MISIIICSRRNQIDPKFEDNIRTTAGTDIELIVIDNSNNQYSIFEAYNIGIERSRGEIQCFIHDDIVFHTQDWGQILESEFAQNPGFSLIGIAGAKVKTQFPTGWWDCEPQYKVMNIIQHEKGKAEKYYSGFTTDDLQEVVVIDGVFMALKKEGNISFDSGLKGYHNYDLNLSCAVKEKGEKIGVTQKILIEHLSIGTLDKKWFLSAIVFHKKYQKHLKKSQSNTQQEIFAGKKYIDHIMTVLGKKKGLSYAFSIFQFSSSLKTAFVLEKYMLNRFLKK